MDSRIKNIEKSYEIAKSIYAEFGVDTDEAIKTLDQVPVSVHCWQGDDVAGFEESDTGLTGGIQATGNYPGKARNMSELQMDLDKALSLIPGNSKVNLHAIYMDNKSVRADRNEINHNHFAAWADWAVEKGIGLDFNPTFFSHPKSTGYTLSSSDPGIRNFWIEHGKACRKIGEFFGRKTGKTCITNIWIPDGEKENPYNSIEPRQRLMESLDEILSEKIDPSLNKDAVESKLFGIGSESYVVGSHEFYMGYVLTRKNVLLTLDTGHFHPTETVSGKISALLCFLPELLLHVSRPVRWDSDHIVIYDDELKRLMQEVVRCGALDKVNIAMDFFDASVNRIAAWVIGSRNTRKAVLAALLEPQNLFREAEAQGDLTKRLLMLQEYENMPLGAVWNYYCHIKGIPTGSALLSEIKDYENKVLSLRD